MIKRSVKAMVGGGVVVITAGVASCSFPTYNIIVTGGAGGGATTTSASATASTGAVGGGEATSSGSAGGSGGASASTSSAGGASSTSTATGTTTSTSSGPCSTDEDGDGAISWQCGGTDCADQDSRAHPGADFTIGAAIQGLRLPGTLPYDFNCDQAETKKIPTLACTGSCLIPSGMTGYKDDVLCGASGIVGHCEGTICGWVSDSTNKTEICK